MAFGECNVSNFDNFPVGYADDFTDCGERPAGRRQGRKHRRSELPLWQVVLQVPVLPEILAELRSLQARRRAGEISEKYAKGRVTYLTREAYRRLSTLRLAETQEARHA